MPWRQVAPGLVVPGSHRDAEGLLDLIENENVTAAFGVPTLWFGLLNALEGHPGRWKCHDSFESCAAVRRCRSHCFAGLIVLEFRSRDSGA
jgi:hypothetical protein